MSKRVLGVLAGKDMPSPVLRRWADSAEVVLAADAGADRLLEAGARPSRIVGDLDSISARAKGLGVEIVHIPDQDTTDCDKLLASAASMGFESVTLASVEGDSLDHLIATVYSAMKAPIAVRFALRSGVGWLLAAGVGASPSMLEIPTAPGRRLSLIPLVSCFGVGLTGVRWPLDGAELAPTGLLSISNQTVGAGVKASILNGAALLVSELPDEEVPMWLP